MFILAYSLLFGDDDDVWICPECSVAYVDGGTDMVCCDGCDNWFHWSCVGLLVAPPENTDWFCQSCIKKKSLKRTGISEKVGSAMKKSKKVL
uniref:PHD-type domain-containing protein n=1 Tax=Syphacia muris TaxID=451379 RepID=A0A0N5AT98_9BILA